METQAQQAYRMRREQDEQDEQVPRLPVDDLQVDNQTASLAAARRQRRERGTASAVARRRLATALSFNKRAVEVVNTSTLFRAAVAAVSGFSSDEVVVASGTGSIVDVRDVAVNVVDMHGANEALVLNPAANAHGNAVGPCDDLIDEPGEENEAAVKEAVVPDAHATMGAHENQDTHKSMGAHESMKAVQQAVLDGVVVRDSMVIDTVRGVSIAGSGPTATRRDSSAGDWTFIDVDDQRHVGASDGGAAVHAGASDGGAAVPAAVEHPRRARGGTPRRAGEAGSLPVAVTPARGGLPAVPPVNVTTQSLGTRAVDLGMEEIAPAPLTSARPLTAPTRAVPPTPAASPTSALAVAAPTASVPTVLVPPQLPLPLAATGTPATPASVQHGDIDALILQVMEQNTAAARAATHEVIVMHAIADINEAALREAATHATDEARAAVEAAINAVGAYDARTRTLTATPVVQARSRLATAEAIRVVEVHEGRARAIAAVAAAAVESGAAASAQVITAANTAGAAAALMADVEVEGPAPDLTSAHRDAMQAAFQAMEATARGTVATAIVEAAATEADEVATDDVAMGEQEE